MGCNELSTASITDRLAQLGSARWSVHFDARRRVAAGEDIIELTIGEPDLATPDHLVSAAHQSMLSGRTGYAGGQGEPVLLRALAEKYSNRTGRNVTTDNVLAFPGTQAALTMCMVSMVESGDAVLVPDPYYATYESVVRAAGAEFVPVGMSAENGFHLTVQQLENAWIPNAKVLLLNSPHNPTGAVLDEKELAAIGEFCRARNLWILSDEVYESLIFDRSFASPFDDSELAKRTVVASSISKSHAAPGFRSGWAIGPDWFIKKAQAVAESFLFGSQPFIADMTAHAIKQPDDTSARMVDAYRNRLTILMDGFAACRLVAPLKPHAGMFMFVDVSATGLDGADFANKLLDFGVAVMPGSSFGRQADKFIRLSLTVPDELLREAAGRIIRCAESDGSDLQSS
ncbi:MAG: pyridoxal phosphate-dependent aminotransferase [Rhizobiaceae bacterium]